MLSLDCSVLFTHLGIVGSHYVLVGVNEAQITQDKIMESLRVLDVTHAKTCELGIFSFMCQGIRICGVSSSRFKEFYCNCCHI